MVGAGAFSVWGPAAEAAGRWLLLAVCLAAMVAVINALSTAHLAAAHPVAGGAYSFGSRELPGPWGFLAGIGFVLGKTASVAAMALTIGAYAWPDHARWVATVVVVAAWSLNARGVTRTAFAATAVAGVVIVVLAVVAGASFSASPGEAVAGDDAGVSGVAEGAALIFFAFAGYARLATLGEEVRNPRRTIPRAIGIAVAVVVALYALLALVVLRRPGAGALVGQAAPLTAAAPDGPGWAALLGAIAAVAAGGAMVALLAGLGRTAMAMARQQDLPAPLMRVNARGVPALAEAMTASGAVVLAWTVDLAFALAMSSVAVLTYYAVANASAFAARTRDKAFPVPRALAGTGVLACMVLAASLDRRAIMGAGAIALVAVTVRAVSRSEWALRGRR